MTLTDEGIEYDADQRHAEIIIKQLGICEGTKAVVTPGVKTGKAEGEEAEEPRDATMYRAMVARANYLSQDRSDMKFAVKELSRAMAKPRKKDLANLKRLGKYLKDRPRAVVKYDYQEKPGFMEVWSDSDWTGCPETRRSTSGRVMRFGTHQI